MRSRYSAYCLGNIAYIQSTMQGKASLGFDSLANAEWAKRWYTYKRGGQNLNLIGNKRNTNKNNHTEFVEKCIGK